MLQIIGEVDIGVKDSMVDIMITLQENIQYWKVCRDNTSSSISGINFEHWKAAASSNEVAELHVMLTYMISQSGNTLTQWCKRVQVIFQNIAGNIKMEKNRGVLLIEVDFNSGNKL